MMILLNFSHPITDDQNAQLMRLTGTEPKRVIEVAAQFDEQQPFAEQLSTLLTHVPLTMAQWQSEPILVVLPSGNCIDPVLLAALHGRMGYFPPVVRTRAAGEGELPHSEVAEILNLQTIRERSRGTR